MSLINQMLKDLEQRHRDANADKKILSDLHSPREEEVYLREMYVGKIKIFLAVALLIILLVLVWSLWVAKPKSNGVSMPAPMTTPEVAPVALEPPPPLPLVDLTEIKISGDTTQTEVKFNSVNPALYDITQDNPQTFSFTLHEVKFETLCNHSADLAACFNTILNPQLQNNLIDRVNVSFPEPTLLRLQFNLAPNAYISSLSTAEAPNAIILTFAKNAPAHEESVTPPPPEMSVVDEHSDSGDYQEAVKLFNEHHISAGLTQLQELLAHAPSYLPARLLLISWYDKLGRHSDAEASLQRGLAIDPTNPNLLAIKARWLIARNCPQSALTVLSQASPPLSDNLSYYGLMAALYQQLNAPAKAALIYERLIEYQPYNANWWLGLGISLESSGQQNTAVMAYQKAKSAAKLSPMVEAYIDTRLRALGN